MKKLLSFVATLMIVVGCSDNKDEAAESVSEGTEKGVVHTTNYPLKYFTQRIAGPAVDVKFLLPADEDPAYWNPTTKDVLEMQKADLILLNGASYESWLKNVTLPPSRIVDTTGGLRDRLIPLEEEATHSHGLEGEHEHTGTAFTTWLDPALAADQAGAIKDALAARWPQHSGQFEAGLAELTQELTALDSRALEAVAGNTELPVLFSHPVYQYLARRYGLNARSVHWEPDQMPEEAEWQDLLSILVDHPARWMIWEDTPLPQISERLEAVGIRSAVFDPCANTPSVGDFLSVMEKNIQALRRVFAAASPPTGG